MDKLTLQEACDLLGINYDTKSGSTYISCPATCTGCSKHSKGKKLKLNFESHNQEGVFSCMKTGEYGGPIRFWGLNRGISDLKEAAKDYFEFSAEHNTNSAFKVPYRSQIEKQPQAIIADVETRDRTYNAFLNYCTLQPEHKRNLMKRGLTEEAIEKNRYRSMPLMGLDSIASTLLKNGYVLEGVPGFYSINNRWQLTKLGSGILIPQRDGFNRIQYFQVRLDNVNDDMPRYISLSSRGKENGTAAYTFCHLRKGRKGLNDIILTEGALKADVITTLTGYSTLSIPGVNSQKYLSSALYDIKEYMGGNLKITIAFDMDIRENIHVQRAQDRLIETIKAIGIPFSILEWDPDFKGLDDWLVRGESVELDTYHQPLYNSGRKE